MRRRNTLLSVVTVVVVVAALAVWLWPRDDVDATTSDAETATLGSSDVPVEFDKPAWTHSLPKDAQVVVDSTYAIVAERTGVRVYELATGTERWHYLDPGLTVTHIAAWNGNLTVLSPREARLFDLDSGELRTTVSVPAGKRTATPVDEYRFLVLSDGKDAYRMYSDSGKELWSRKPESCATSTQAYFGSVLVLGSSCPDRVVLDRIDRDSGNVDESAELSNLTVPAASNQARLLPKDAPILLTSADGTVAAVNVITLTAESMRPAPPRAELTPVRNGWCAYTASPEPVVTCQDQRTGAAFDQPYHLTGAPKKVRVFAEDGPLLVAGIAGTSLAVGETGDHPREVVSGVTDPDCVYYGPGALVVTTKDTLSVYAP